MSYDFDQLPNAELLKSLGQMVDEKSTLDNVFAIAYKRKPLEIFKRSWPELRQDIEKTKAIIEKALSKTRNTKGMYIGLDTLNMDDGNGTNAEIQTYISADLSGMDTNWMFGASKYDDTWLLGGLYEASKEYDQYDEDDRWFAQYVTFITYSGVVIGTALKTTAHNEPYIAVWGFHDGDMYKIAKSDGKSVSLNPFPDNALA